MLSILHQDDWLIAVDKPAGYLVHPSSDPKPEDLVVMKILRDQIEQKIHVIHRLDQPTSGVLLFATHQAAAKKLRRAFEMREVAKTYLAMVLGHPSRDEWICEEALVKNEGDLAQLARTSFSVMERLSENLSLVEARPETGRFHQIRKHLLHEGHPIVGDFRYHDIDECFAMGKKLGIGTRMLLQAKTLELTHPMTREKLIIEAPLDLMISQTWLNQPK